MFDAQRMQVGDGLADPGLERILDTEHADDRAVDRQIQRRQTLHLELDLLLNVGLELRALILEYKVRRTDDGSTSFDGRSDAVRHDVLDGGMALAMLEPALACRIDHGACHRMREMLLRQAERRRISSSLQPSVVSTQARRGCASVSVPVLSNTMVSALANDSKYFAPLTMTPILAASLMAVMTATEPVSLSAHE